MQHQTTRRAVMGAIAAIPVVALAVPAMATTGNDSELLATFAAYCRATTAFNGCSDRDGGFGGPLEAAYLAAMEAMDETPEPVTLAGVIAKLRFALSNIHTAADLQNATLHASPAERAAVYRARWDDLDEDAPHIAGAILALEAMGA